VERNENDLKLCELFQQCHVPTPRHSPYARVAKIVVEPSMRSGVRLEFVEEREPSPFLTPLRPYADLVFLVLSPLAGVAANRLVIPVQDNPTSSSVYCSVTFKHIREV